MMQGEEIRELKKSKPDKETIQPYITDLLALKAQYKEEYGKDYAPPPAGIAALAASSRAAPASPSVPTVAESPAAAELAAKIAAKV